VLPVLTVMFALFLAGCGSATATPTVEVGKLSAKAAAPRPVLLRIAGVLQEMASDYERGDIGKIAGAFTDRRLASSVQSQFEQWDSAGAHPLHVMIVFARQLGPRHVVATVQFSSDPRAIPAYQIFDFRGNASHVVIDALPSGISGTRYLNASWQVTRSPHFAIYHSPYELQGSDRAALGRLEHQRALFEQRFGVKVAPFARYYLYPEQTMMGPLTDGLCGSSSQEVGCALALDNPPTIHTSEWPSYHEPIHVYEHALEPTKRAPNGDYYLEPLFIAEGTAVALEDRWLDPRLSDYCSSDLAYIPLDACADAVISHVQPLRILSDSGFQRGDVANSYLIGGSFVKYLILHYGYHRFGRFYYVLAAQPSDTVKDYDVATKAEYGRTIQQLLDGWRAQLCSSGC